MISRAVSHDGTVVYNADTKDGVQKCAKCRAPQPEGKEFHYITCALWKEWQQTVRRTKTQDGNSNTTN